jgi:hypothetical protein
MSQTQMLPRPSPVQATPHPARLGTIVGITAQGLVLVRYDGEQGPPIVAHVSAPLDRGSLLIAIAQRHKAVLMQVEGTHEPIILSTVVPAQALVQDAPGPTIVRHADRMILKAGRATITLHNSGKIDIRGVRIVSRADADHRITGNTVRIN